MALERAGTGVRHVVGVGGRDLTDEIGAAAMLGAIESLDADEDTKVIVVVAKQIGLLAMHRLITAIERADTPIVTCLFGQPNAWVTSLVGATHASSLAAAAGAATALFKEGPPPRSGIDATVVASKRRNLGPGRLLRGAFAGGTLAYEASQVLSSLLGDTGDTGDTEMPGVGHTVVDLGDDRYTCGQPHPMINPSLQADFIKKQIADPQVGVVLFDVVLGHGSHDSPAEALARAVMDSRTVNNAFVAVASVVGASGDPQDLMYQREILADAGVIVFDDTATAAMFAGLLVAPDLPEVPVQHVDLSPLEAVINVGARWFANSLDSQGVRVLHVDWHPPAGGDDALADALDLLS